MLLLYVNSRLVLVYLFHLYSIDIYPFINTNINCIKRPVYISIFLNIDSTDNKYHRVLTVTIASREVLDTSKEENRKNKCDKCKTFPSISPQVEFRWPRGKPPSWLWPCRCQQLSLAQANFSAFPGWLKAVKMSLHPSALHNKILKSIKKFQGSNSWNNIFGSVEERKLDGNGTFGLLRPASDQRDTFVHLSTFWMKNKLKWNTGLN